MIDSAISTNHHYYVFFFKSPKIKSLSSIPSLFSFKSDFQVHRILKHRELDFCHLQLEIDNTFGASENILQYNRSKRRTIIPFYWYDFYLGKIEIKNESFFYICYPYNRLGKFLEGELSEKGIQTTFYKPEILDVLEYMKLRNNKGISKIEKEGLNVDITRYSAEVNEDSDFANKINIIGANPLKSRTYELLNNAGEGIKIKPISLKLKCKQLDIGDIDISFDRIGNYRFWLKRNAEDTSIPTIPFAFKFLMETAPLKESNFLSSNTLLENE